MSRINGAYIEEPPFAHAHQVFVAQDSIKKVHDFAHQHHVSAEAVERLLVNACDEDNYRRDIWHARLGDAIFEFHLARLRVELRSIKRG